MKDIEYIITDFDGILTDNCVYIDNDGNMSRKINFKDVMGCSILYKNGYKMAIISGEKNKAIDILTEKFKIENYQDIRKKLEIVEKIIKEQEF